MKYMGLNEIREKFLSFFEQKEHLRHKSFSLVPDGDNSLLLINSGMAPLKPYFSGEAVPPRVRMTTCQKCIRTPDIERVGKTSRHGTFFEMLGNFSFGDYFKNDATAWAWEFCTEIMGLPKEKLYVSVYLDDDEAWDIWTEKVGVDPSHMVRLGKEDNFWEIGQGPCGPCSEIYFDRGTEKGCGKPDCKVGCDCDRFVEFWNLVFTQFNNDGKNNYTPLAKKNIDTGMGLERLACIMQEVDNLFEVDTTTKVREKVCEISSVTYNSSEKTDVSIRVITDHIRSTVMLISDGVLPSNEGRGYVLRRLLRRASRHGRLLGVQKLFLTDLSEVVIAESGDAYPELLDKRTYIQKVISVEEERFNATIDSGMSMLTAEIAKVSGEIFPGEPAFKLYDTFGFPVDLTIEILSEQGKTLDIHKFNELMQGQKNKAREARKLLGDKGWSSDTLDIDKTQKTNFVGYTKFTSESKIISLFLGGEKVETASEGDDVLFLLDTTPFYAESGGQTADRGSVTAQDSNATIQITDVKKTRDGQFLHIGKVTSGEVHNADFVFAEIDISRRRAIMRAHSATHLLQKALREVLGDHVQQAGSFVEPDNLRFDFTHFSAMTDEEVKKTADKVNEQILNGLDVNINEMSIDDAKKEGAMALFGEKYGDVVRVVKMGNYSAELCGGTHLENTAFAGSFVIGSETSIAAGVRRIEGFTGKLALRQLNDIKDTVQQSATLLKTSISGLPQRVEHLLVEQKSLVREIETMKQKSANDAADGLLNTAETVGSYTLITATLENIDGGDLRKMGEYLQGKNPDLVVVLVSKSGEKLTISAVCGAEAVKNGANAGKIVGEVCKICGGKGGGKPDAAMGGGKDSSKINEAYGEVKKMLSA